MNTIFSLVFLIALLLINHTMIPIAIAAMWLGTLVGYYGVTRAIVSSEELDAD